MSLSLPSGRPNKVLWLIRLSVLWKIAALLVLFVVLVETGVV
ncbi:MAG TPA: hypothetical protein VGS18_04810 [Thermoplasmata archaeon]|nr:hypothetical protein [Thermoplasmata archaeon]HEV2519876.1 hypothetical protein [Thermoplasmata archaeon]